MITQKIELEKSIYEKIKSITRENSRLEQILYTSILSYIYLYTYDEENMTIFLPNKWTDIVESILYSEDITLRRIMEKLNGISTNGISASSGEYDIVVKKKELEIDISELNSKIVLEINEKEIFFHYILNQHRIAKVVTMLFEKIVANVEFYIDMPMSKCNFDVLNQLSYNLRSSNKKDTSKTFLQLFKQCVKEFGTRKAVSSDLKSFTYEQIDQMSDELVENMSNKGIGSNESIGVEAYNYPELIISVVVIAKMLAIYVPLDSNLPNKKREDIISDSGIRYILHGIAIEEVSHYSDEQYQWYIQRNQQLLMQENPSYLIYTSGSTGKPKGCLVNEKNMLNLCLWYRDEFLIDETSKIILANNFSFDASIKNIYTTIISGAEVIMGPQNLFDTFALSDIIENNKVTHLNCVPALFEALLKTVEIENYTKLENVKYIILGGETFKEEAVKKWARLDRCKARFANVYGPAECTSVSTFYHFDKNELMEMQMVPIGLGIDGKEIYIFNSKGKQCLPGMIGTLFLGGIGLIEGYTKEEFNGDKYLENAFGINSKLYNTGDLVYYEEDGLLYYVGRHDNQIKINGQRIELEEIESIFSSLSAVEECATNIINDELVLFYATITSQEISLEEIIAFMEGYFTKSILPSKYIYVDKLPRNENGKVARQKLQLLVEEIVPIETDVNSDINSEFHKGLVKAWEVTLDKENISTNKMFFEQGGSSLLLYKLKLEIKKYTGHDFEMVDLFNNPSIELLKKWIESGARTEEELVNNQKEKNNPRRKQRHRKRT